MAKQTINIGSSANDGLGDPLRTAMDKINDNFDEIYAAGPVSSNIKIANSTVTATNTNGNLILRGNGLGKIDVGAVGNLRITGGANGYVLITDGTGNVSFDDVGNITFTNLLATSGNITQDLVVGGNLTVNGTTTTINTNNLDVEDKLITIAYGAANSSVADGAGINIAGANANITYVNATNSFNFNKNAVFTGNIVPSANVTYSLGNATNQWKDLYVSNNTIYINNIPLSVTSGNVLTINGQAVLSNSSNAAVSTTGNVTANYFFGNGSQLTGLPTPYGNANVVANLAALGSNPISTTGNITANILTATESANLGSLNFFASSITMADDTWDNIFISPNGESYAYLSVPKDSAANVQNTRLHNDIGNVEIGTGSGTYTWLFDAAGNLTIPNGGYINFVNTGGITQALNEDLKFTVSDDEEDGWAVQSTVNDGAGNDLTRMQVMYDGVAINTDIPTNNYRWDFRDTGEFDVPGPIRGPYGGNLVIKIGDQPGSDTYIDLQTRSYVGDGLISNVRIANPNVTVSTASGAYNWTFDNTGNLTAPGAISAVGNISGGNLKTGGLISATGNIAGNNISATNITLSGTGTAVNASSGNMLTNQVTGTQFNFLNGLYTVNLNAGQAAANYALRLPANAGSSNQVLTTDGSGNLSWTTPASTYGNANVVANLAALGSNPISTTGNITGGNILGGANVNATTHTGTTVSVTGNIDGGNLRTAGLISATGNITSAGNISGGYILGNGSQLTGLPATYGNANVVANLAALGSNPISTTGNITGGNFLGSGSNVDIVAGSYDWTFDNAGNLTLPGNTFAVNYANGTAVSLGGSYGNANVVANLAALGSNPISTTGNITGGYILGNGALLTGVASSYGNAEVVANLAALGSNPISTTGNITGGNLIASALVQGATISSTGNIVASGNIVSGLGASNNFVLGNVNSRLTATASNSYITMDQNPTIVPDTAKSALSGVVIGGNGYLLGPNGSRNITLNYGASSVVGLQSNVIVGTAGSGTLSAVGTTTTGINAVLAGPTFTPLANTSAGFVANVNNYTQITFQNKNTGADATADYILTADNGSDTVNYSDFGIINSGYDNSTPTNSLGNIVYAADTYIYAQGNVGNTNQSGGNLVIGTTVATKNVKIFAGGNTASALVANISNTGVAITGALSTTGNITANNITGSAANVTITANAYVTTFDTTGTATFPGTVVIPNLPAFRVYGNSSANIGPNVTITSTQGATVDYNQGSHYNASTGTFTAPVSGLYQVNLIGRNAGNTTSYSQLAVIKNIAGANTVQAFIEFGANSTMSHAGAGTVSKLASGDTLNLRVAVGTIQFDANDSWSVAFLG